MTIPGWKTRVQFFAEEDSHGYPKVWNFGGEDAQRLYIESCMQEQRIAVLEAEVSDLRAGFEPEFTVAQYDAWLEANDTEDPDYGY